MSDPVFASFLASFQSDGAGSSLDLLDSDVVVTDWMMPGVTLRGRPAVIAKFYAPLPSAFPDVAFEITQAVEAGSAEDGFLAIIGEFTGTFKNPYIVAAPPAEYAVRPHGRRVRWMAHDVYQFKNGKIVRIWFGNDTLTVARQLECLLDDPVPW